MNCQQLHHPEQFPANALGKEHDTKVPSSPKQRNRGFCLRSLQRWGRSIHTEASKKGIGTEGVDFGAAATPA